MVARVIDETANVRRRMKAGTVKSLGQAAAYVRGIAVRSIGSGFKKNTKKAVREGAPERSYTPSAPGKPPKSPTRRLKKGIAFDVDKPKGEAVVGPTRSAVGRIGSTHEFSGTEPAKKVRRSNNWKLEVGGHGPIRGGPGRLDAFAKLKTEADVQRSHAIADAFGTPEWDRGATKPRPRKYPARPFMGPALARSRDRLPAFWKNALKRS